MTVDLSPDPRQRSVLLLIQDLRQFLRQLAEEPTLSWPGIQIERITVTPTGNLAFPWAGEIVLIFQDGG